MSKASILYIFVEGDDDERFFKQIVAPILKKKYSKITIQKYSEEKRKVIAGLIKTVQDLGFEYILVSDKDDFNCVTTKKDKLIESLGIEIPQDRIAIVVREIEGWYLCGLGYMHCKKFKLPNLGCTETVCKEVFEKMIPSRMLRIEFMQNLLESFDLEIAKTKNNSFRHFVEKHADF